MVPQIPSCKAVEIHDQGIKSGLISLRNQKGVRSYFSYPTQKSWFTLRHANWESLNPLK